MSEKSWLIEVAIIQTRCFISERGLCSANYAHKIVKKTLNSV